MELTTWNVQEYELTGDGDDKAYILYRPLTQGWRARHLKVSLRLQRAAERLVSAQNSAEDNESDGELYGEILEAQADADRVVSEFRLGLFSDLVVGCRTLTINDKEPTRDELIQALLGIEDLGESLSAHILAAGQISEPEGKD